ncbi:transposase [Pantoea sp. VH_24]|nr:transposase [Pantoea sp. VH_24]
MRVSSRFGYRRIWQLLRREGLHVNHKRVYRIYHLNDLTGASGSCCVGRAFTSTTSGFTASITLTIWV